MSDVKDLWGEQFPDSRGDSTPVTLLKQQAEVLKRRTAGRIEGVVVQAAEGGSVWSSLYAQAAALQNYRQKILTIAHSVAADPVEPYPLDATECLRGVTAKVTTPAEFAAWLETTLSSDVVHQMIGNLLRYSRDRVAS